MKTLFKYNKQFLIVGPIFLYQDTFEFYKNNQIHFIPIKVKKFLKPDGSIFELGGSIWMTSFPENTPKVLQLTEKYNPEKYRKYDSHDIINVDKSHEIPIDYEGKMGVPVSFLQFYNPEQFEILDFKNGDNPKTDFFIDGKRIYNRIVIKRKAH